MQLILDVLQHITFQTSLSEAHDLIFPVGFTYLIDYIHFMDETPQAVQCTYPMGISVVSVLFWYQAVVYLGKNVEVVFIITQMGEYTP